MPIKARYLWDLCDLWKHIFQRCFIGTGAIVWKCHWNNPEGHWNGNIVILTKFSSQNNKFRCSPWWKFHQNDISVSVDLSKISDAKPQQGANCMGLSSRGVVELTGMATPTQVNQPIRKRRDYVYRNVSTKYCQYIVYKDRRGNIIGKPGSGFELKPSPSPKYTVF